MIKIIISTFGFRMLIMVLSFASILLTTNFLGPEGHGLVSLILLGITIVLMVNNLIGGNALVYLAPRRGILNLLLPSYGWAFICAASVTWLLHLTELIAVDYSLDIGINAFLHALTFINIILLLGRQRIVRHNIVQLLHYVLIVAILSYYFVIAGMNDPSAYISALYTAHITTFLLSFIFLLPMLKKRGKIALFQEVTVMVRYGFMVQIANLAQMMNYRISYFILEYYTSTALVGIYALGVSISESLWIIGRSVSMVYYSRTSNTSDFQRSVNHALFFAKLVALFTCILMLVLLSFPASFFVFLFGEGFADVKKVLLYLSPGVIIFSYGMVLSHFFSGTGRHYVNAVISVGGLFVTLVTGIILIPLYELPAAAAVASLSYFFITAGSCFYFIKVTGIKIRRFIPDKGDVVLTRRLIRKVMGT